MFSSALGVLVATYLQRKKEARIKERRLQTNFARVENVSPLSSPLLSLGFAGHSSRF